jgi:hypothetical protein
MVDGDGMITAVAEGQASIVATYRPGRETRRLVMPVSVDRSILIASPRAPDVGKHDIGARAPRSLVLTTGCVRQSRSKRCASLELDERVNQAVDIRSGRIHISGGARRFGHAESLQERQGGHVAGANRNPSRIQRRRNGHR